MFEGWIYEIKRWWHRKELKHISKRLLNIPDELMQARKWHRPTKGLLSEQTECVRSLMELGI